ncbi:hypothetical protein KM803_10040 [Clostridium tyrobutyricum]|uniref:hypothetical protein n=1 Tax=Clostridium tyrobutyricum TaxID=1519 RepID=UPI001C391059|nr:hypothetical protein [Clostridium tyrobutyricum]MBV4431670.1 hypothetical protein [Clostridium tyrobutyricum]
MLPVNGLISLAAGNLCYIVCAAACGLSSGACAGVCLIDGPSPLADVGGVEVSATPGTAGAAAGGYIADSAINGT